MIKSFLLSFLLRINYFLPLKFLLPLLPLKHHYHHYLQRNFHCSNHLYHFIIHSHFHLRLLLANNYYFHLIILMMKNHLIQILILQPPLLLPFLKLNIPILLHFPFLSNINLKLFITLILNLLMIT